MAQRTPLYPNNPIFHAVRSMFGNKPMSSSDDSIKSVYTGVYEDSQQKEKSGEDISLKHHLTDI